jgi:hypothetical protein
LNRKVYEGIIVSRLFVQRVQHFSLGPRGWEISHIETDQTCAYFPLCTHNRFLFFADASGAYEIYADVDLNGSILQLLPVNILGSSIREAESTSVSRRAKSKRVCPIALSIVLVTTIC